MKRNIHDIYDVILKIIITTYKTEFLRYIHIKKNIKEVLNTEFITVKGDKLYLDFLCLLDNDTLCNIEFQFPKARLKDLDRFFNYNITVQVRHQKLTETVIINFSSGRKLEKIRPIGKTKCFKPKYFNLGDIDFERYFDKINIKSQSNLKLTHFEEITLMLICLLPNCKNRTETLQKICNILKKEELFDRTKLEFIQAVIKLEIENLLTPEEQSKIKGELKMSPQSEKIILQAINDVNKKVLNEAKIEGKQEGIKEGIKEGKIEGKIEGIKKVAKNLKGTLTPDEISQFTGLTVQEIKKL